MINSSQFLWGNRLRCWESHGILFPLVFAAWPSASFASLISPTKNQQKYEGDVKNWGLNWFDQRKLWFPTDVIWLEHTSATKNEGLNSKQLDDPCPYPNSHVCWVMIYHDLPWLLLGEVSSSIGEMATDHVSTIKSFSVNEFQSLYAWIRWINLTKNNCWLFS